MNIRKIKLELYPYLLTNVNLKKQMAKFTEGTK